MTALQQAVQQALRTLESGALLCESTAASMLRVALEAEQAQAVEPVAWSVTVGDDFANCIEITHCKEDAYAQYEASTAGGFESIYRIQPLYTRPSPPATGEPYDQQALELCDKCGWKAIMPGEPCLLCSKDAQRGHSLPLDLLERLSKTLINLGYSTPEGGMEHFGARIESQLYNLCRGVDSILAQQVAAPAPMSGYEISKWWASENGLEDCDMCIHGDFAKVVRAIEAHHGIEAKPVTQQVTTPTGCHRSYPHEEMNEVCKLKTEIAQLKAALRASHTELLSAAAWLVLMTPLRKMQELDELKQIGHRQFGRALVLTEDALKLKAIEIRRAADALVTKPDLRPATDWSAA